MHLVVGSKNFFQYILQLFPKLFMVYPSISRLCFNRVFITKVSWIVIINDYDITKEDDNFHLLASTTQKLLARFRRNRDQFTKLDEVVVSVIYFQQLTQLFPEQFTLFLQRVEIIFILPRQLEQTWKFIHQFKDNWSHQLDMNMFIINLLNLYGNQAKHLIYLGNKCI